MRQAARTDANHSEIVKAFNQAGMGVRSLAAVGDGMTDIIVGFRGLNCLIEIKDPNQPPSKRQLTAAQQKFHAEWPGQIAVVETADAAIEAVLAHARKCGVI